MDDSPGEVDILPHQVQDFTPSHAGRHGKDNQLSEPTLLEDIEEFLEIPPTQENRRGVWPAYLLDTLEGVFCQKVPADGHCKCSLEGAEFHIRGNR